MTQHMQQQTPTINYPTTTSIHHQSTYHTIHYIHTWRITSFTRAFTGVVNTCDAPWNIQSTIPPLLKMTNSSSIVRFIQVHCWMKNCREYFHTPDLLIGISFVFGFDRKRESWPRKSPHCCESTGISQINVESLPCWSIFSHNFLKKFLEDLGGFSETKTFHEWKAFVVRICWWFGLKSEGAVLLNKLQNK